MITVDAESFLASYRGKFGGLRPEAEAGLRAILASISQDKALSDMRWAAYMLATVKHECADTWRPIEEYGKGRGRPYGEPKEVKDAAGKVYTNAYYGRGYVQITWDYNYRKLGEGIGLGDELLYYPEKALEPAVAYSIMSFGMRNGVFTARRLSQFINATGCDYYDAREIINGHDKADLIKGYAEALEAMLKTSAKVAP
jgi:hypothetical protein